MFKPVLAAVVLFLFVAGTAACAAEETAGDQWQGDFLSLSLGDTEDVVTEKLQALDEASEIQPVTSEYFTTMFLGEQAECMLSFAQNRLCAIRIALPAKPSEEDFARFFADQIQEKLKPFFVNLYGDPAEEFDLPAPAELDDGALLPVEEWYLEGKTVLIGIVKEGDDLLTRIEIYDDGLMTEKTADEEAVQ